MLNPRVEQSFVILFFVGLLSSSTFYIQDVNKL